MTVAQVLNGMFCTKQVQIFCFEGGPFFELAFWCSLSIIGILLFRKWIEGPVYEKPIRIDGKVAIVTGSNTGIGREIALELAKRGGRIYMACRSFERCEAARRQIIRLTGNTNVFYRNLDLSSQKSIREFVDAFDREEKRLDILINNAGIMATPRLLTVDGIELQFGTNYLGHFLLTNLLLKKLKSSVPSRIVILSSIAHLFGNIKRDDINSEKSYNPFKAYAQSKLANILFTHKLAQRLRGTNVTVNCMHPGSVHSKLSRYHFWLKVAKTLVSPLLRSPKGGAQTALYLALDPELENMSGGYYDRMNLQSVLPKAKDDEMADWLWNQSEILTKLKTE